MQGAVGFHKEPGGYTLSLLTPEIQTKQRAKPCSSLSCSPCICRVSCDSGLPWRGGIWDPGCSPVPVWDRQDFGSRQEDLGWMAFLDSGKTFLKGQWQPWKERKSNGNICHVQSMPPTADLLGKGFLLCVIRELLNVQAKAATEEEG